MAMLTPNLCRMTTAFVDFNGVVPEKVRWHRLYLSYDPLILVQFDAVRLSHLVTAEYGNQGLDFKMVPREGFGWMNGVLLPYPYILSSWFGLSAAYQVGLSFLTTHMRRAVAACTSPEVFFGAVTRNGSAGGTTVVDPLGLAMEALTMTAS